MIVVLNVGGSPDMQHQTILRLVYMSVPIKVRIFSRGGGFLPRNGDLEI
jgi:hypothetical protein